MMEQQQKHKCIGGFYFKSTTLAGDLAKYRVQVYDNNVILIVLMVLTADNIAKGGFRLKRNGSKKKLWEKFIHIKQSSLAGIVNGWHMVMENHLKQTQTNNDV